jgi:hypothetical protein
MHSHALKASAKQDFETKLETLENGLQHNMIDLHRMHAKRNPLISKHNQHCTETTKVVMLNHVVNLRETCIHKSLVLETFPANTSVPPWIHTFVCMEGTWFPATFKHVWGSVIC